ncbi:MAG: class I SAM-dependent methyltransferase, partial [Pseudohongiellaceae bacterium]
MNRKQLAVSSGAELEAADSPRYVNLLRALLVNVLSRATQGHFLLRERGRVIAEVGERNDPLSAEVDILDTRCYLRALLGGDTGAGEAYVDGWWTTPDITALTRFFARNLEMMDVWGRRFGWLLRPLSLLRKMSRANSRNQAKKNILAHYDLGNELYRSFLDGRMQYSSAIYNHPGETLEDAQINKLTRLCEQLELGPDDHLLEVGTGWGELAIFAAQHFGCRVTTTTISDAQWHYASARVREAGLEDRVTVLNRD